MNDESPKYSHYQTHQRIEESPGRGEERPPERPRRKKKKNKSGSVIALAVVFGLVAGVVFQSVNLIADKYLNVKESGSPLETTQSVSKTDNTDTENISETRSAASGKGLVADVAQAAMPSVVAITSVSIQEIPTFFGYAIREYPSTGSGSGIIVGENEEELLIATNFHVVEGASTLSVCFIGNDVVNAEEETMNLASGDGDINIKNAVSARIKGTDEDNDLAVISVKKEAIPNETMKEIKIANMGSSDDLAVGEQVVAIGNALGYGQSVTSGWVSALSRTITLENGSTAEVLQTDAAINPGNSGGALLNMSGELIGINAAKYSSSYVEGMGYAIPISTAQPILEELMNRKTRTKVDSSSKAASLGVSTANISAEAMKMYNVPAGAFVIEVISGEAAEQAGIQKNDIIVKMDGQKVSGNSDLADKLQYYTAGEQVEMVIARAVRGQYQEQTVSVTLGARPE